MLRRALFVSALMLAGTVGFASSAKAAPGQPTDTTVKMTGSINTSCTLSEEVDGILTVDGTGRILDSENGGTSGEVKIVCTGAADVEITNVTQDSGLDNGADTTDYVAKVTSTTLTANNVATFDSLNPTTGTKIDVPGTGLTETAKVDLKATYKAAAPAELPDGSYQYTVSITATPK